jgi:TolA-binding protein
MALVKTLILALLLLAPPAVQARQAAPAARLTDAQIEALAKTAMVSSDPRVQADVLRRLQTHHFKSSLAVERESVLGVQGLLEDRLGKPAQAAETFHKLEQSWPRSPFLAEGQVIMADNAVERKRYQEAESRLHKALDADLPAESQRRAQELLLWCLAEEGRAGQGGLILKAMKPLGNARPSEKGLVGIMEAQCAAQQKTEAEATFNDYHRLFPNGPRSLRMDLDRAKLLGSTGDAYGAAEGFQRLIQAGPAAPEADEARLALATLLTDGKLHGKDAEGFPEPQALLSGMGKGSLKDAPARQAALVKGRIALKAGRWQEVLAAVAQYRALHPSEADRLPANELRAEAMRKWTQELLDRHQAIPLLPYLDAEGIRCLTPEQRLGLTRRFALGGLPEAGKAILPLAPPGERPALLKAALEGTSSGANPQGTLDLLPGKNETAEESLMRAQAELALRDWSGARAALAKASAGPERIQALLAYLNRPPGAGELPAARLKEVDAWLARAPEKGPDREPLAILAGDLRVRGGDWRGALARYPVAPQPANRGWVLLMRATCQARLGQAAPARATLKQAGDDPAFKNERLALSQRLGP